MPGYVTFCYRKPCGPESGCILRPVPEVVLDLYQTIEIFDPLGFPTCYTCMLKNDFIKSGLDFIKTMVLII